MRRTLLTAGVFALLAMIYVPTPTQRYVHPGYRFIFSTDDTSIAFFQLLVNVVFAALLGAILATIVANVSRRTLFSTAGCITVIALGVGVFAFCRAAAIRAQGDEEMAEALISWPRDSETMYAKFRNASTNWRLALQFDEAMRVENRIKELQKRAAEAWRNDPVVDLSGLPDQAPSRATKDLGFVPDSARQPTSTPIPRARPVQKLVFDDLIPARTATPPR